MAMAAADADADADGIPSAMRLMCSDFVHRLDQGLDEQLTTDIRNFILACQQQGVWPRLRETIPFPGRAVFDVLAQAKPLSKRAKSYRDNICLQWGIQTSDFHAKFFGASSQGFFDELNRLAFADECPAWAPCWNALLAAREERLRGATGNKLVLWQPSDIHRAARSLGISVAFKRICDPSLPGKGNGHRRHALGPRPLSPPLSAPLVEDTHGDESEYESDGVSPNGSSTREEQSQERDDEEEFGLEGFEAGRRRDPTPARPSFPEGFDTDDIPDGPPVRKRQRRNSHSFAGGNIREHQPDDYTDFFSPQRSELGRGAATDSEAPPACPKPLPPPPGSPFQLETAGLDVTEGSPKSTTGCEVVGPVPVRALVMGPPLWPIGSSASQQPDESAFGFRRPQMHHSASRKADRPDTPFPLQPSLFPPHHLAPMDKSNHDMATPAGFGPYVAPARDAGSRGVKRSLAPLPLQTSISPFDDPMPVAKSNHDVGTQTALSPPHHPTPIEKLNRDMGTQTFVPRLPEPKGMEEGSRRDMQTQAEFGSDPTGALTLQPGSREEKRLMDPQAWIDDTVIDMALSACAALGQQHDQLIAIPSSLSSTKSNPENHPVYVQHLKALPRDHLEALVPLNTGDHWVLAQTKFGARTVYVYDSMSSARQGAVPASTQELIHSFLVRLFGENPAHWQVALCASPQQDDHSSCGVFSIATAFYLTARIPLPAKYSPLFWRSLILCLLSPSREKTSLWPFSGQDDDAATKAWLTQQASPDTERHLHHQLSSGSSVTQSISILQQMMDGAKARLDKCQQLIHQDIAARQSVLAELAALDSILHSPGAAGADEGAVPGGGLGLSAADVDKQWCAIETTISQFALCPELAHPAQISLLGNRRAELRPVKLRMKLVADGKRLREVLLQRLGGPIEEAADAGLASVERLRRARLEMEL